MRRRGRIAGRVAEERVSSTVDPEARHAHETRTRRQDGYKAHVAIEPNTGIVTDTALTPAAGPANSDAAVGIDLLAGEDDPVQVLADDGEHRPRSRWHTDRVEELFERVQNQLLIAGALHTKSQFKPFEAQPETVISPVVLAGLVHVSGANTSISIYSLKCPRIAVTMPVPSTNTATAIRQGQWLREECRGLDLELRCQARARTVGWVL